MRPRQTPAFEANVPGDLSGDGPMAARLAAAYFGEPLEWQPRLLDVMLARDRRDLYAVRALGVSMPRQNGKSWVVRARCFYGALNGEKILYTCQHGDTSDEMFRELSRPFQDEDEPELAEMLEAVRKVNGQQAIRLKNGGLIRFTTRTDSLARGKTYDVLVYDEAQDLTESQQAASLPTISAGARRNPQTIYLGTPPRPGGPATVFRSMRDAVVSGESSMCWIEWGVGEVGDPRDRARWHEANPSLGTLVDLRAVEAEAEALPPDVFARERLGWWPPSTSPADAAIDADAWAACESGGAMEGGRMGVGVKFSPDGSTVAVSWARAVRGGGSYVELYDVAGAAGGSAWIADMLARRRGEVAAACIDGKSGAAALVRRLADSGFPRRAVIQGTPAIVQAAAAMMAEEVASGTLSHIASPALDASATGSVRRAVGRDGWAFGDGPAAASAPVESASLALYAARTARRDTGRRQEASF